MVFCAGKARLVTARQAARNMVRKTGKGIPVDICGIAELLGFFVEESQIRWAGYIASGENVIVVRRSDTLARKRFTIAHEIGHILWRKTCKQAINQKRVFKGGVYCEEERIANDLAAELLMPMAEFKTALLNYRQPSLFAVRDLSKMFGVSFEACARRITEIPNFIGFSYSYEVSEKDFGEFEIRFKRGYSGRVHLRFSNPPFDIVRKCLQHNLHTNRMWVGQIKFLRGNEQIQIPIVGGAVRINNQIWVRLVGWRYLDAPIVGPMQSNQLIAFYDC